MKHRLGHVAHGTRCAEGTVLATGNRAFCTLSLILCADSKVSQQANRAFGTTSLSRCVPGGISDWEMPLGTHRTGSWCTTRHFRPRTCPFPHHVILAERSMVQSRAYPQSVMPGCAPRVHTELAPMDTEASTPSARNLPMGRFPGFHPHFVTTRTSPSVGSAADTSGTTPLWRASGAPPSHYRRSGTGPRRRRISIEGFGSPMGVRPLRGDRRAAQAAVTMPVWGQRSSPWPHPPRGFRSPAYRRTALLAARGRW